MNVDSFGDVRDVDILLVESNPQHATLFEESFESEPAPTVHSVSTGEDALDYITQCGEYEEAPQPDLVVLNPELPHPNGFEILEKLKSEPELRLIPVIVLASSDTEADIERSYELHANAYVHKAEDEDGFSEVVEAVAEFWLSTVRLPPKRIR